LNNKKLLKLFNHQIEQIKVELHREIAALPIQFAASTNWIIFVIIKIYQKSINFISNNKKFCARKSLRLQNLVVSWSGKWFV
jgi:hypothetical protein